MNLFSTRLAAATGIALALIFSPTLSQAADLTDKLSLGGLIEVEAGYESVSSDNAATDKSTSGIVAATGELQLHAEISDEVTGHIGLLWEEEDPIGMDEAYATVMVSDTVSITGGKMYIPFGAFNTHLVSDPLTLDLGETNESALMATLTAGTAEISVGLFNGYFNKETVAMDYDDMVGEFFFAITVEPAEGMAFGASYMSSIADTDSDITGLVQPAADEDLVDVVGGYGIFASIATGDFSAEVEYIAAAGDFDVGDLANLSGQAAKPSAYNVEVAYATSETMTVAARFEGTKDWVDMPKTRYGAALSTSLNESTSLAFEVLLADIDDNDNTKSTVATAQLGMEF